MTTSENLQCSLTAIILTHNQIHRLRQCLENLRLALNGLQAQTIVVDNGSKDGTPQMLTKEFPEVQLIYNHHNRGVAAARNQGLRQAHGKHILILDNDTVVPPDAINTLKKFIEENPNCGLVAPTLLNADGSLQESAKEYPSLDIKISNILGLKRKKKVFPTNEAGVIFPTYVIGACQLFRSSLIDQIGYLDEKIFYGPEDADWCLRIASQGQSICLLPDVKIWHYHRKSTRRNPFSMLARKHIKGLLYFYKKWGRWW